MFCLRALLKIVQLSKNAPLQMWKLQIGGFYYFYDSTVKINPRSSPVSIWHIFFFVKLHIAQAFLTYNA